MSDQRLTEVKRLLHSTGECDVGPKIFFGLGGASIRYDIEVESGVVWAELRFRTAVALRVTPDIAVTEELVSAYSRVCEMTPSSWLDQLRSCSADGALPETLRHFVVYFDHFGAVEVVASGFEVFTPAE